MNLVGQFALGIILLFLLGLLVVVKRSATGAVLDKPQGEFLMQFINVYNLFFLLVVNPLVAILLLSGKLAEIDLSHQVIETPPVLLVVELVGLLLYIGGFVVMAWSLIRLGRNYQLGGSIPRSSDTMITDGPYGLVRHPMYSAVLSISAGLALVIQSWAAVCVFLIYLVLVLRLIRLEEDKLLNAYGEPYRAYQRKTRMLFFILPKSSKDL